MYVSDKVLSLVLLTHYYSNYAKQLDKHIYLTRVLEYLRPERLIY